MRRNPALRLVVRLQRASEASRSLPRAAPPRRRPPATPATFPVGNRISLQRRRAAGRFPVAEMEEASLLAGVGIHPQRVVVLPGDVQAFRHAQQRRRAIGLALSPEASSLAGSQASAIVRAAGVIGTPW